MPKYVLKRLRFLSQRHKTHNNGLILLKSYNGVVKQKNYVQVNARFYYNSINPSANRSRFRIHISTTDPKDSRNLWEKKNKYILFVDDLQAFVEKFRKLDIMANYSIYVCA